MKTSISFRGMALAGAALAVMPLPAMAQDVPPPADDAEEESPIARSGGAIGSVNDVIVVTGTKTQNAEDVQDVPLAVTAFNSQSLEALKVRDV